MTPEEDKLISDLTKSLNMILTHVSDCCDCWEIGASEEDYRFVEATLKAAIAHEEQKSTDTPEDSSRSDR